MENRIDHIVYSVPNLEEGIDHFEALLGVRPVTGGSHEAQGTKNALLNLGNKCYLEILASDELNTSFNGQRWMGIDLLKGPKITRWSLKTNNIDADCKILQQKSDALGHIIDGERRTKDGSLLTWKMSKTLAYPEVDIIPFLTDWSASDIHPTDALEASCMLKNIYLFHPDPEYIESVLSDLNLNIHVERSDVEKIEIEVVSPTGVTFIC